MILSSDVVAALEIMIFVLSVFTFIWAVQRTYHNSI